MASGSRSRTGCYTCRIRKKKCDEQHPCCGSCLARSLPCYGYDTVLPDWMLGGRSWKEVMLTEEARQLQSVAEVQYKARRRTGQKSLEQRAGGVEKPRPSDQLTALAKITSEPDSLWWDSGFCTSLPVDKVSREDVRLLKLYLDFIFPVQFSFYPMSTTADHSWLTSGLCSSNTRYHAALSISACFDESLRETARIDGKGLSLEVSRRQGIASSGLRMLITQFNQNGNKPKDVARIGTQILEIMHHLLSLEVFSMLEGAWESHHHATMTLLNTLHNPRNSKSSYQENTAVYPSLLDMSLKDFSSPDTQRNFEFHVTCVVWIDIIANATFGSPKHIPRHFDYVPYLHANLLKTHDIMGCHSTVMADIAEITRLADWKASQLQAKSLDAQELTERGDVLATSLMERVRKLEKQSILEMTPRQTELYLATLQFAYAAQIYLHVVVRGADRTDQEMVSYVERNLQLLENLPHRVMIRVHWAFTITGCSAQKPLYDRFRGLIARIFAQGLPPGVIWKGLIVMEECWRLRDSRPELEASCDWKTAMESLGKRILLP